MLLFSGLRPRALLARAPVLLPAIVRRGAHSVAAATPPAAAAANGNGDGTTKQQPKKQQQVKQQQQQQQGGKKKGGKKADGGALSHRTAVQVCYATLSTTKSQYHILHLHQHQRTRPFSSTHTACVAVRAAHAPQLVVAPTAPQ